MEQFALQVAVLTHADPVYLLADGPRAGGWLAPWVNFLESVLVTIQDQLDKVHIPYSYGFSIILLTLFVKVLTFPVVKTQVSNPGPCSPGMLVDHGVHSGLPPGAQCDGRKGSARRT